MTVWIAIDEEPTDRSSRPHPVRFDDQEWALHIDDAGAWVQFPDIDRCIPLRGVTKFSGLFAEPDYASDGTTHLAAAAPMLYVARGVAPIGIEDVTTGTYELTWFDLAEDRMAAVDEQDLDGGDETFSPPPGATGPFALLVRRTSR